MKQGKKNVHRNLMPKLRKHKKGVIAVGVGMLILVVLMTVSDREQVTTLQRPDFGEDELTEELVVSCEDDLEAPISINLTRPTLSGEALMAAYEETYAAACEKLLGENASLQKITTDLHFVTKPGKYGIRVDYMVSDEKLVDYDGTVFNENLEEPKACEIELCLYYGRDSVSYVVPITVYPRELTDAQRLRQQVLTQIPNDTDTTVVLPTQVNGKEIRFYRLTGNKTALLGILVLGVAISLYYRKKYLPKKRRERRELLLKMDYSQIVSKLSLLVGAGMSMRNAFARMVADYNQIEKEKRPAYEEMRTMVNRIETGVAEEVAYRDYGRACMLPEYMKLGALISQSVRKGNDQLLLALRKEVIEALANRRQLTLQEGERMNTKLVIPMIMMLGIVFIIIMVPAFMAM